MMDQSLDHAIERWLDEYVGGAHASERLRSSVAEIPESVARRAPRWPARPLLLIAAAVALGAPLAFGFGSGLLRLPTAVVLPSPSAVPTETPSSPPPSVSPTATSEPSTLPSNGWIAYTAEPGPDVEGDDLDIWFVGLDEPARRVIGTTSDDVHELCPAFSPDGDRLAYGRVEGDGTDLNVAVVVADVADDGEVFERTVIEVGPERPPCPVWSPGGDRIAFGVPRTSPINPSATALNSEVWVVRLSDQTVTKLTYLLATDLEWSPDGTQLAIASGKDWPGDSEVFSDSMIYVYSVASGEVTALEGTEGAGSMTWSPDGTQIAFPAQGGLRAIDLESVRVELLSGQFPSNHGIGPVWSPTGEYVAYQRITCDPHCSAERHEVVLVAPDDLPDTGVARETVITMPRAFNDGIQRALWPYRVSWSPDGNFLLYIAWGDAGMAAVPIDQSEPAVLLSPGDGLVPYDGYDDTSFVPIQVWQPRP